MRRGRRRSSRTIAPCTGDEALNSPHTRLGRRRTHTTPGFRPGLHEAAATLLDEDDTWATSPQVTHANRRIRGSPFTHDTAGGQDFQLIVFGRPLPDSAKRRSRNSSITPPLRGSRRSLRWGVRTRRANGEILCAVAGKHRPTYRRRLVRWPATAGCALVSPTRPQGRSDSCSLQGFRCPP